MRMMVTRCRWMPSPVTLCSEDELHASIDCRCSDCLWLIRQHLHLLQRPDFPELRAAIEAGIKELGGCVAPKFSWSSPHDATWVTASHSLACSTADEASTLSHTVQQQPWCDIYVSIHRHTAGSTLQLASWVSARPSPACSTGNEISPPLSLKNHLVVACLDSRRHPNSWIGLPVHSMASAHEHLCHSHGPRKQLRPCDPCRPLLHCSAGAAVVEEFGQGGARHLPRLRQL